MNHTCPFCKKELIKELDGSQVCYCGAEPRVANLTVDYYTVDYYNIYLNFEDYYLGLCFEGDEYNIFSTTMTSTNSESITTTIKAELSLEEAADILIRYSNLKVFL